MPETIYTIPINEAFEYAASSNTPVCPFCKLESDLEANEIDLILGASMMEPDIRIKTNKSGFCPSHFDKMLAYGKRLPMALILESHLCEIYDEISKKDSIKSYDKPIKRLSELNCSCYVCDRISYNYKRILSNAVYMWSTDDEFRKKTASQKTFCVKHFCDFVNAAAKDLSKKEFPDFYQNVGSVFIAYFKDLSSDVSWFCKKFDYRYDQEPWYNAKDSVERAVAFLSSDIKPQK